MTRTRRSLAALITALALVLTVPNVAVATGYDDYERISCGGMQGAVGHYYAKNKTSVTRTLPKFALAVRVGSNNGVLYDSNRPTYNMSVPPNATVLVWKTPQYIGHSWVSFSSIVTPSMRTYFDTFILDSCY